MKNPLEIKPGTIYIAGPITNMLLNNFPAFEEVQKKIEAAGFKCINPHEIFEGIDVEDFKHRDYMKVCVSFLAMCDIVVTLEGWADSTAARQEVVIAREMGKDIRPASTIKNVLEELHGKKAA